MDFMPTKGIEYLLAIGYLALLVLLTRLATRMWSASPGRIRELAMAGATGPAPDEWFQVPEGILYHRGHTWARPGPSDTVRVGVDDFAYHFLGNPSSMMLPAVGTVLEQGTPGFHLRVDGHLIDMLSPVDGEVIAVNDDVAEAPQKASADPYDEGWLIEVRPRGAQRSLKNLLPHSLARSWMKETSDRISGMMGRELGVVMQDGGLPIYGFGRHIGGDRWHALAAELFLTDWRSDPGIDPLDAADGPPKPVAGAGGISSTGVES